MNMIHIRDVLHVTVTGPALLDDAFRRINYWHFLVYIVTIAGVWIVTGFNEHLQIVTAIIHWAFILVGCMSRYIYVYHVYLSNIPAIATENLLVLVLFLLFTTCLGPYGPSSGEIQHHLCILKVPSILQRIRCSTIVHSCDVSLLLSITIHIMVIEF
jgi:hypothetical protein